MWLDFLRAFDERERNAAWLQQEKKRREPACDQDKTECVRCGWCCVVRTCVPTPDEMPAIAEHLGLTVEGLVKNYMVGDRMRGHQFLRFANDKQADVVGTFLDDWRTYDKGECLLYRDHSCLIWPGQYG